MQVCALISISQLVLIAIVIFIGRHSVIQGEDAITQNFVSIKFTVTLTLASSTLTHCASHFYVPVSAFFKLHVCFTVQLNLVGTIVHWMDDWRILQRGCVNEPRF